MILVASDRMSIEAVGSEGKDIFGPPSSDLTPTTLVSADTRVACQRR